MFYCLSMCLNTERKEQFADLIYCISFLCNSSCGSWQLEIFLKLNDYWLIDWPAKIPDDTVLVMSSLECIGRPRTLPEYWGDITKARAVPHLKFLRGPSLAAPLSLCPWVLLLTEVVSCYLLSGSLSRQVQSGRRTDVRASRVQRGNVQSVGPDIEGYS